MPAKYRHVVIFSRLLHSPTLYYGISASLIRLIGLFGSAISLTSPPSFCPRQITTRLRLRIPDLFIVDQIGLLLSQLSYTIRWSYPNNKGYKVVVDSLS